MKSKISQKTLIITGVIIILALFTVILYLNNEMKIQGQVIQEIQTPQPTPIPTPTEENLPLIKNPPIREFQITATQSQLTPATITVKQYDFVRLIVDSIDVSHGITITGYNINRRLEPRETRIIEFMADKKGEFSITCTTPCNPEYNNIKGKLVVN